MPAITFAGLASGIDTNGLIDATSEAARATRVKPNQKKVTELEETNSAMEELNTKFETLRTTLAQFNTLAGGGVSKAATSSSESVITATAANSASNGAYSITVTDIAKPGTFSFGSGLTATSSVLGASAETVTFTIGTDSEMETVTFNVAATTTASEFVTSFNAASSKAEATLVNTGTSASPSYKVVVSSIYEGTEKGTIALSTANTFITGSDDAEPATNAQFSIAGIGTITRATNSVSDVITGVSLSLVKAGTSTLRVAEDTATTSSKIQEFITQFNEIVSYVNQNNQITRQESGTAVTNIFAPLSNSRTDDSAVRAIKDALSSATASAGSGVRIFADIGITTERDGTLKFDSNKFQTAISAEPSSVSSILTTFADTTSLTGGSIDLYTRFNGMFDMVLNNNKTQITNLNQQISEAEKSISKQEDDMRARFARLESLMGRLQQQQSALTSALSGLGR